MLGHAFKLSLAIVAILPSRPLQLAAPFQLLLRSLGCRTIRATEATLAEWCSRPRAESCRLTNPPRLGPIRCRPSGALFRSAARPSKEEEAKKANDSQCGRSKCWGRAAIFEGRSTIATCARFTLDHVRLQRERRLMTDCAGVRQLGPAEGPQSCQAGQLLAHKEPSTIIKTAFIGPSEMPCAGMQLEHAPTTRR